MKKILVSNFFWKDFFLKQFFFVERSLVLLKAVWFWSQQLFHLICPSIQPHSNAHIELFTESCERLSVKIYATEVTIQKIELGKHFPSSNIFRSRQINSQSLEDAYTSQKYTLEKYTLEIEVWKLFVIAFGKHTMSPGLDICGRSVTVQC